MHDDMRDDIDDWPTGRLLSVAARSVDQAWRRTLESLGLSRAGLIVLHLTASGPVALTELARGAHVTVQTMSRTVEKLVKSGHVQLTRDETDARRRLVERTPLGDEAFARIHDLEDHGFDQMAEEQQLRALLREIIRMHQGDNVGGTAFPEHPAATLEE